MGEEVPGHRKLTYEPLVRQGELQVSRSPWGPDDEIGRLNWMTPAGQAELLARIDGRRVFDLSVDYFMGMPSWASAMDPKYDIWMTHTPQGTINDNLTGLGSAVHETYSYSGSAITMYTHVGTHLCSLNHIGLWGRFWNGWAPDTHLGSRAWRVGGRFPPIIARAVLVDVAGARAVDCLPDSYAISAADVREALDRQAVELRQGDIALVRTGRMTRWPDQEGFLASPPGLGMDSARLLCEEIGVMCIGVDAGGEALPPERPGSFLPVHAYLLATAGTPLFENLWLEEIARAKVYESVFVALPLKLLGSTGAPVRPIAFPFGDGAAGRLP
jgi:kynurenine formamidase